MGAVASIPGSRARQVLPGTPTSHPPNGRSPSPTTRAPTTTQPANGPTRVDSGLWTGNRMLFGPHFILRYPLARPPHPTNLPPNTMVSPGVADLGTAMMVTDQISATAASAATLGSGGGALAGITPEMIAGWRAGRNEVNPHPGELHVVSSALRCVVNVRRLSLSMPLLPDLGNGKPVDDNEDSVKRCNLTFVVDSEVPCVVKVYLLVQEQEGKILHHMVPAFCSSPIAVIPLSAGMGQLIDLVAHNPAGILVQDVLYHYAALINMYFPASAASPSPSPPASPRSASPSPTIAAPDAHPTSPPPQSAMAAGSASSRSPTPLLQGGGSSRPGSPFPSPPITNTAPIYPLVIVVSGTADAGDGAGADDPATTCTEQWTMVAIDPRDWEPRVIKQKLWLPAPSTTSLLLQEIYGFTAPDGGGAASGAGHDPSQQPECIVCMADAKDTMVLPCRHLCLCKECGNQLRRQSSKCPICRQDFHSLLHVATAAVKDGMGGEADAAAGKGGKKGGGAGGDGEAGGEGAGPGRAVSVMRTAAM